MRKIFIYSLLILFQFNLGTAVATPLQRSDGRLHGWKANKVLIPTKRKPARTAILIIAPPTMGNCFVENRWKIGKKVWEQHMNIQPNVDCFFLQSTNPRPDRDPSDQVWIEGNTIYVGDVWYEKFKNDRLLHKTVAAMEFLLPNYTHFIRTNLNAFFNLRIVNDYMETHHESFYTTPLWQGGWYTIGYSILYTADVAAHIVSEYRRLEAVGEDLILPHHADDGALTALATGVWPYLKNHPFRCCPTLPSGVRQLMDDASLSTKRIAQYGVLLSPPINFEKALEYCERAPDTVMLYRTNGDLNLIELAQLYQFLLYRSYNGLLFESLVGFAEHLNQLN